MACSSDRLRRHGYAYTDALRHQRDVTNGTPQAAAVKMGSGAFAPVSIQNGQTFFTVPAGTTSYTLAEALRSSSQDLAA